jgi:integrase
VPEIAKELGLLRSVLRYAAKQGSYRRDSTSIAALLPDEIEGTYVPRDRALSQAEYQALHAAMGEGRRDYLAAWCLCGARESELYSVTAADVDLDGGQMHLRGTKTGGSDRWIPIQPDLLEVLERRADATPEGPLIPEWPNVRRDLRVACAKAKISPVSCNDLRRTFATWLAEAGVAELVTASLMGHASTAMVRRVYTKIGQSAKRAAVASLPRLGGAVTAGVTEPGGNSGRSGQPERPGASAAPTRTSRKPRTAAISEVPRDGIEPPTRGFSVPCSTN